MESKIKHEFISDPEEYERRRTEGRGNMAANMLSDELKRVLARYPVEVLMLSFVLKRYPEDEFAACRAIRYGDHQAVINIANGLIEAEMITAGQAAQSARAEQPTAPPDEL